MPLVRASVTQATWSEYSKAWDEWMALVGSRWVDVVESDRLQVTMEYMLRLREQEVSAAVAQRRLSGLSFHFKLCCWSDVSKLFIIHQALKGRRKEYVRLEHRRPISYSLLVQLLAVMDTQCASPYEAVLFCTCFCLAFFSALCISKLVPLARHRNGGLMVEHVVLANEALCILIRRSKTDILGWG